MLGPSALHHKPRAQWLAGGGDTLVGDEAVQQRRSGRYG